MRSNLFFGLALCALPFSAFSQYAVPLGKGSYASTPPAYKSKTDTHDGYQAGWMLTRQIFCDEKAGVPIPTNDWWTDVINNRFSGALWSYPAMIHTGDYGVKISYPSYWADEGKEIKSRTSISVSASGFIPDAAIATDWHDLDFSLRMPDRKNGAASLRATLAHGIPFTWFEFTDIIPTLSPSDKNVTLFGKNDAKGQCGMKIGDDLYAIYYPAGSALISDNSGYSIPGADWIVVALLTAESDLDLFAPYAPGIITDSKVSWHFDEKSSEISTQWDITTRNLRDESASAPVILGLLPHTYKYSSRMPATLGDTSYSTPRGLMKMYASDNGSFRFAYTFSGMLPYYAAPEENLTSASGFRPEIMKMLTDNYAAKGTFGADTYWGGKGLVQMALNMTFAKSTGNIEAYQSSKDKLKETFVNWLTYTPGEDEFFFSYYPRWGSMLGFNVSYDSDAFNDHHFHYGYFTYAAALLCMEDPQFAADYGEILTLIAKDYANYDRNDYRFPFMRTLDPWCGHSWAGGMGDAGNDNGNGQESTSEAMQSWGGMYLLGVALNDKEMRDAGIWGWNTEARATREYWFDVDSPRPANDGGRKAWAGKNDRNGNYDYTQYKYAYNSNITGKGIGWWTWFGGDPLFMHGIQWMPVSPALDYLSWDNDFVDWAYQDMMSGANSDFSHEWFTSTVNSASGDIIEPLADNDWGNVTLAYMQRSRPAEAAEIFDRALKENRHIATAISTGHISYYLIHHHLTYGDIDFSVSADTPTASAYVKDGKYTYMVYNPEDTDKEVNFFRNGVKVYSVLAPAKKLTPFTSPAVPASLSATLPDNGIIPPGAEASLTVEVFDQYGAHASGAAKPVFSSEGKYINISADGIVSVNPSAPLGSREVITVNSGDLTTTVTVSINHLPVIEDYIINGIPQFIEKGTLLHLSVTGKDQYGVNSDIDINKWVLTNGEVSEEIDSDFLADTPGRFQLLAYGEDDMTAPLVSETIVILPTLPDVAKSAKAISSSEENVGTSTSNVNDGDSGSRWGSAHNDNEWIMLDLGEEYYLTVATVNWEAAFGKDYIFQVAPADAPLVEYTGNYAGATKKYSVPAEQSWQTVSEVIGNTRSGNVASNINASGRYLRLKGLTRSTPYGYSIYEMEVRGMSLAGDDSSIAGIDAGTPEVGNQGEEIALRPVVFYRNGDSRDIDVVWSADKEARFDGNNFTPLGYGLYNLTAKYGEYRSSTPIFINEGIRMASITLSPDATIGISGEDLHIAVEAKNQFGGIYTLDDSNLTVTITDTDTGEQITSDRAWYDVVSGIFHTDLTGNFTLSLNDGAAKCDLQFIDIVGANLALGKDAVSSSAENGGLTATMAVDGDYSTRWGSQFFDGENILIDLGRKYLLSEIKIYWDAIAYATHYTVDISDNGVDFNTLFTRTGWSNPEIGNDCRLDDFTVPENISARFIRLIGEKRSTQYGTSIREFEVYGNHAEGDITDVAEILYDSTDSDTGIYNLQGIRLRENLQSLRNNPLPPGIYLTGNKKIRL